MQKFKKLALAAAVASSFTLVGCGGGGGSSSTTPAGGGDSAGSVVSGAAVKGVLKSARITVFELDKSGDRIAEVGSATTNDDGEYEAALTDAYQGGLLEIEVTTIPGRTKMVCDASACGSVLKGQDLELPANFKLNAIASRQPGADKVSASVTAWTTMAAKRAKSRAAAEGDIATATKEANYQVQQIVGFDPAKVAAKDVAQLSGSSKDEQQAAVMNAVVAELVFSDSDSANTSDDYLTKLEKFTGALEKDDTFGDADDGFKMSDLAAATEKTIQGAQIADAEVVSKLQSQQAAYEDPANEDGLSTGEFNPDSVIDETASQEEKIANFQEFVAGVRTWATSIDALDTAQLGEVVDVETIEAVFTGGPIASLKLMQEIVNQSLDVVAFEPTEIPALLEGEVKSYPILDGDIEVGTAKLTASNENGLEFNVVGAVSGETNTKFLPFKFVYTD